MKRYALCLSFLVLFVAATAPAQETSLFINQRIATTPNAEGDLGYRWTGLEVLSLGRANLSLFHVKKDGFLVVEVTPGMKFEPMDGITLIPGLVAAHDTDGETVIGPNLEFSLFDGLIYFPVARRVWKMDAEEWEWGFAGNINWRGVRLTGTRFGENWEVQGGHLLPPQGPVTPDVRATYSQNGLGGEVRFTYVH